MATSSNQRVYSGMIPRTYSNMGDRAGDAMDIGREAERRIYQLENSPDMESSSMSFAKGAMTPVFKIINHLEDGNDWLRGKLGMQARDRNAVDEDTGMSINQAVQARNDMVKKDSARSEIDHIRQMIGDSSQADAHDIGNVAGSLATYALPMGAGFKAANLLNGATQSVARKVGTGVLTQNGADAVFKLGMDGTIDGMAPNDVALSSLFGTLGTGMWKAGANATVGKVSTAYSRSKDGGSYLKDLGGNIRDWKSKNSNKFFDVQDGHGQGTQ